MNAVASCAFLRVVVAESCRPAAVLVGINVGPRLATNPGLLGSCSSTSLPIGRQTT